MSSFRYAPRRYKFDHNRDNRKARLHAVSRAYAPEYGLVLDQESLHYTNVERSPRSYKSCRIEDGEKPTPQVVTTRAPRGHNPLDSVKIYRPLSPANGQGIQTVPPVQHFYSEGHSGTCFLRKVDHEGDIEMTTAPLCIQCVRWRCRFSGVFGEDPCVDARTEWFVE
jgi:hypothetical protein